MMGSCVSGPSFRQFVQYVSGLLHTGEIAAHEFGPTVDNAVRAIPSNEPDDVAFIDRLIANISSGQGKPRLQNNGAFNRLFASFGAVVPKSDSSM